MPWIRIHKKENTNNWRTRVLSSICHGTSTECIQLYIYIYRSTCVYNKIINRPRTDISYLLQTVNKIFLDFRKYVRNTRWQNYIICVLLHTLQYSPTSETPVQVARYLYESVKSDIHASQILRQLVRLSKRFNNDNKKNSSSVCVFVPDGYSNRKCYNIMLDETRV